MSPPGPAQDVVVERNLLIPLPDVVLDAPAPGLHEIERWWERWLRGRDDGVTVEPPVCVHPGTSHVVLPRAAAESDARKPAWGAAEPDRLRGPADLGAAQRWQARRDLMADLVTLEGAKEARLQLDPLTRLHGRHRYTAAVASRRPDLARMESTTEIRLERPLAATELLATTVTTGRWISVTAVITLDGKPVWTRTWSRGLADRAQSGGTS